MTDRSSIQQFDSYTYFSFQILKCSALNFLGSQSFAAGYPTRACSPAHLPGRRAGHLLALPEKIQQIHGVARQDRHPSLRLPQRVCNPRDREQRQLLVPAWVQARQQACRALLQPAPVPSVRAAGCCLGMPTHPGGCCTGRSDGSWQRAPWPPCLHVPRRVARRLARHRCSARRASAAAPRCCPATAASCLLRGRGRARPRLATLQGRQALQPRPTCTAHPAPPPAAAALGTAPAPKGGEPGQPDAAQVASNRDRLACCCLQSRRCAQLWPQAAVDGPAATWVTACACSAHLGQLGGGHGAERGGVKQHQQTAREDKSGQLPLLALQPPPEPACKRRAWGRAWSSWQAAHVMHTPAGCATQPSHA